jgi:hypothetical protein
MKNLKNRGIITTYIALLMILSALIMQSVVLSPSQKTIIKASIDDLMEKEENFIEETVQVPVSTQTDNKQEKTLIEKFYSELDGIEKGSCDEQSKILSEGTLSNGVKYTVRSNCLSFEGDYSIVKWWGEGILLGFDGKYMPLNWLISKDYVPDNDDIRRIYKNYSCEALIYIHENYYNPGDYSWENGKNPQMNIMGDYILNGEKLFNNKDDIVKMKSECKKFLNMSKSEQIQFQEDRGFSIY